MGAYGEMAEKIAGGLYGLKHGVDSFLAGEAIDFGLPLFGNKGEDKKCYLYHDDRSKAAFDADFVASNVIAGTLNGVAYSVNFDTDQLTTINALITALLVIAPTGAVITLDATDVNNRTILIDINGVDVVFTATVTGGASQAVATMTVSSRQVFVGVAGFKHKESFGVAKYELKDMVNVVKEGDIIVPVAEAVLSQNGAFVITSGANKGKFGTTGLDIGGRFRESGNSLVRLEVNKRS